MDFIETNPSISRPVSKKSNDNTENLAGDSALENMKLVTENMAKINVKQGNIAKAVKIYQALQLKIPAKKVYFAERIEELKDN